MASWQSEEEVFADRRVSWRPLWAALPQSKGRPQPPRGFGPSCREGRCQGGRSPGKVKVGMAPFPCAWRVPGPMSCCAFSGSFDPDDSWKVGIVTHRDNLIEKRIYPRLYDLHRR